MPSSGRDRLNIKELFTCLFFHQRNNPKDSHTKPRSQYPYFMEGKDWKDITWLLEFLQKKKKNKNINEKEMN